MPPLPTVSFPKMTIPDTVSPVYSELSDYVGKRYPDATDLVRSQIFSVAYTIYCRRKKIGIQKNISVFGKDSNDDIIKYAHRVYNNEEFFAEICDEADKTTGLYLSDEIRKTILETTNVVSNALKESVKNSNADLIVEIKKLSMDFLGKGWGILELL